MPLPTPTCFRALDYRDQLTQIYAALLDSLPAPGSLPSPECVRSYEYRGILTEIYAALRANVVDPSGLPTPECFLATVDIRDQLTYIYQAIREGP